MSSAEQPYGPLVGTTISVATWNVWGRFGPWPQRQRGLVAALRSSGADVVLLQECWFDDTGEDQARQLGTELGFSHCFGGGTILYGDWGPGNAVLSRWPIGGVELHDLPALTSGWGGVAQRAVIEGPRRPILVYNVALDWPPHASAARQHALRALARTIAEDPLASKAPLIVAGDFNAGPDSDEIRMLLGGGSRLTPPSSCSTPGRWPAAPTRARPGRGQTRGPRPTCCPTSASTTSSPAGHDAAESGA